MSIEQTDVIVIGGGLAGSSLSIALARRGIRVLLLEAETRFRDRVRGEALFPWGVREARNLGIYDLLVQSGARSLPYRSSFRSGHRVKKRHLTHETTTGEELLTFEHASVQETLIRVAVAAGARVIRGAKVQALDNSGVEPKVHYELDGQVREAMARLVVGASGRSSAVRSQAGFDVSQGSFGLMTAGVALEQVDLDQDAFASAFNLRERKGAMLFPQGDGRARAYVTFGPGALPEHRPLSLPGFIDQAIAAGLPDETFAGARAAGPLATFDGTPKWVESPYRDGVALIGDAAATSDPAWGQGMALALRDARVLAGALTAHRDIDAAGRLYAGEHDRYSATNRIVSSMIGQAQFGTGAEAELLRSSRLWLNHGRQLREIHLNGPDAGLWDLISPFSEEVEPHVKELLVQ